MTVRIKICGITRVADALAAERLGADALGFVFFPKSPRYVSPEDAREICRQTSPFVARVGVFVNREREFIEEIVTMCGLSAVQLSGDEPADFLADTPFPVIRAVRIKDGGDIRSLAGLPSGDTLVLDTFAPGSYGGTGVPFDWDLLEGGIGGRRIVMAGGLTPENVGEAVRRFRPYGVDVASGVEERPGIKDHIKIGRFIRAVRSNGGKTDDEIS